MLDAFRKVLEELEAAFRRLEAQVPPPIKVDTGDGFILRYQEKTVQQMLLQKFARLISGLYAIDLLHNNGFLQEQCAIQRTLDEIEEDILFICLGITSDNWTENHKNYEADFWMEEPGPQSVRRHKIRAFNNRADGLDNPSAADANGRLLYQTYSGYIHAASTNVIEMCIGNPPSFRLSGQLDSPLLQDHKADIWNYFYRALMAVPFLAKVFGDNQLGENSYASAKGFEKRFAAVLMPTG